MDGTAPTTTIDIGSACCSCGVAIWIPWFPWLMRLDIVAVVAAFRCFNGKAAAMTAGRGSLSIEMAIAGTGTGGTMVKGVLWDGDSDDGGGSLAVAVVVVIVSFLLLGGGPL